MIGNSIT